MDKQTMSKSQALGQELCWDSVVTLQNSWQQNVSYCYSRPAPEGWRVADITRGPWSYGAGKLVETVVEHPTCSLWTSETRWGPASTVCNGKSCITDMLELAAGVPSTGTRGIQSTSYIWAFDEVPHQRL